MWSVGVKAIISAFLCSAERVQSARDLNAEQINTLTVRGNIKGLLDTMLQALFSVESL